MARIPGTSFDDVFTAARHEAETLVSPNAQRDVTIDPYWDRVSSGIGGDNCHRTICCAVVSFLFFILFYFFGKHLFLVLGTGSD